MPTLPTIRIAYSAYARLEAKRVEDKITAPPRGIMVSYIVLESNLNGYDDVSDTDGPNRLALVDTKGQMNS